MKLQLVLILLINNLDLAYVHQNERYQSEKLYVKENTAGVYCGIQGKPSEGWEGDNQMLWQTTSPDHTLVLEFDVPKDGTYMIGSVFTQCIDFATVDIYIDNVLCVVDFDGYSPYDRPSNYLNIGTMELKEGTHDIKIYNKGKSEKSSGYIVAIDYFDFTLMQDAIPTEPTPTVEPTNTPAKTTEKVSTTNKPGSTINNSKNTTVWISIAAAFIIAIVIVII